MAAKAWYVFVGGDRYRVNGKKSDAYRFLAEKVIARGNVNVWPVAIGQVVHDNDRRLLAAIRDLMGERARKSAEEVARRDRAEFERLRAKFESGSGC